MGYSGSGKSTLAQRLAKEHRIPLLHLDSVHFLPGWVERDPAEEEKIVGNFLATHEEWVIEGEYASLHYERRLAEADCVYLLITNRFIRLYRVLRRTLKYRGRTRPDLAEGCIERFTIEFIKWVLWDGCGPTRRQRYERIIAQYPEKTTVIPR
ncbi:hypothetical protein [uncultured Rothia sp.]|uniref:hypothetical protein n=1 Tax=uncultured Rothia sp. TaxID=316088 RepID=UPI0032168B30